MIKFYESKILSLQYEDLLHFLLNETHNSGFFDDTNFEKYKHVNSEISLKWELINNLENEYSLVQKLNK
jgi:hypothetical protein